MDEASSLRALAETRRLVAAVARLSTSPAKPTPRPSAPPSPAPGPAAAAQLAAWLVDCRLEPFADALHDFGVVSLSDVTELTEADAAALDIPLLPRRRLFAAAASLPASPPPQLDASASTPAGWLAPLRLAAFGSPLQAAFGVYDVNDLSELSDDDLASVSLPPLAVRRLRAASPPVSLSSLARRAAARAAGAPVASSFCEWLSALRLQRFQPPLAALGVACLADAAEVAAEQLTAPWEGQQQGEQYPPLPSHSHSSHSSLLRTPSEHAQNAPAGAGMGVLAARRCAAAAARAAQLPGEKVPPCDSLCRRRTLAAAAAASSPREWLSCLRLDAFVPFLCGGGGSKSGAKQMDPHLLGLGVWSLRDVSEVTPGDAASAGMPPLQRARFFAAADELASRLGLPPPHHPPPLPANDPSFLHLPPTPYPPLNLSAPAWLDALRLGAFAHGLAELGVDSPPDFAEVSPADLDALRFPPLQRRRFLAASRAARAALLAPPHFHGCGDDETSGASGEAARASASESEHGFLPVVSLPRACDALLALPPSAWLAACRLSRWLPAFERAGVRCAADFADAAAAEDEGGGGSGGSSSYGCVVALPPLPSRRFRLAAARTAAAAAAADAAAADGCDPSGSPPLSWGGALAGAAAAAACSPASPAAWLAPLRIGHHASALLGLGVRTAFEMMEVRLADLTACGLKPLERRRFAAAAAALAATAAANDTALDAL